MTQFVCPCPDPIPADTMSAKSNNPSAPQLRTDFSKPVFFLINLIADPSLDLFVLI
jgi:hypothetical protein